MFNVFKNIFGKKNTIDLPPILEPLRKRIEDSAVEYVKITTTPDDQLSPYASKFFGQPYLPLDTEYPLDTARRPMIMVAQLNFAEIPPLPDFPTEGILQFYIADNDLFGLSFKEEEKFEQKNFRLLWFPQPTLPVEKLNTNLPKITIFNRELQNTKQCKLTFSKEKMPVTLEFTQHFNIGKLSDDMRNAWPQWFQHQIGGYPSFTQEDPRKNRADKNDVPDVLLLQINADDNTGFSWGDMGIANWFISRDNLLKQNFSNVLYNWDCS
jgi:uncharacterized protein YwqG